LIAAVRKGTWTEIDWLVFGEPLAAISSALRGMFIASPGKKLYVADFSAIEARVVMWVAKQENALRAFRESDRGEGPDIYCVFAESVVGHPVSKKDPERASVGKIGVLGCGYQMGWSKLQLQASQATPPTFLGDEMAQKIVKTFRTEYDEVPDLWRGLEDAAIHAAKHRTRTKYLCIGFEFVEDAAGPWLTMILPSGRRLWYFRPEVAPVTISYEDKVTGETKTFTKDQLTYEGKDNKKSGAWQRVSTYGGMLTENAVQAIARDLMVASMIRAEENGYPVILTVHDEVISERDDDGTGDVKEFEALIAGPNPPWATGLPVAAEAWTGYRYRK
jgi:DNA polymerase